MVVKKKKSRRRTRVKNRNGSSKEEGDYSLKWLGGWGEVGG